jgi:hypothetical protein
MGAGGLPGPARNECVTVASPAGDRRPSEPTWLGEPGVPDRELRPLPGRVVGRGVAYRWRSHRYHGRRPVLDDLVYEDSESPAIGLVPAGVSWEEVQNHIKIAHHPLLVPLEDSSQYVGAYWTGTQLAVADDLGSDQDQAIREFREFLREHGEA